MSIPVSANSALAPRSPTPATASSCSTAARNEGGRYRPQPLAYARDLLFEKVVLSEQLVQQKAVMLGQLSLQSTLQLGNLLAQLTLGQLRQYGHVFLPSDQRFDHLAPRYPQHITGHRTQFD